MDETQPLPQQQPALVYPVNMTDHDLLIRVDQKLSQLSLDVGKTNDGLTSRIGTLEGKISIYDRTLAEYPPGKLTPMLLAHDKWINDFQITWKTRLALATGMGSLITFILTALLAIFHIVNFAMPK